jgi:hypothetical protein
LQQAGARSGAVQHFFDRFLASAAVLSHVAVRVNVVRAIRAVRDRTADFRVIQPIADADDHPENRPQPQVQHMVRMRMIVNHVWVAGVIA